MTSVGRAIGIGGGGGGRADNGIGGGGAPCARNVLTSAAVIHAVGAANGIGGGGMLMVDQANAYCLLIG
jgi:hypothetical protein